MLKGAGRVYYAFPLKIQHLRQDASDYIDNYSKYSKGRIMKIDRILLPLLFASTIASAETYKWEYVNGMHHLDAGSLK